MSVKKLLSKEGDGWEIERKCFVFPSYPSHQPTWSRNDVH